MNSEINFKQMEHEDSNAVVSFNNGTTFKVCKFMENINTFFRQLILNELQEKLRQAGLGTPPRVNTWNTGVDAEILEPKSGEWKKGKVRMRVILEFCPDEPEDATINNVQQNSNSLDDIRQTIS
ncbi:KGK domain-containing protein [Pleurocapsa sp. FMAR1]|uniref:KGK domain-containing protein n=1 Tax=Pleurocapsa sp. FMAR1 TaxID=3040204 RepID=UPI0029C722D4|nr:KGK domain-containing protein [Pleurocapsa sp. FMAR1]